MIDRIEGKGAAKATPIGNIPTPEALNLSDLDFSKKMVQSLLAIDLGEWKAEVESQTEFLSKIGDRLPKEILTEQAALRDRLKSSG